MIITATVTQAKNKVAAPAVIKQQPLRRILPLITP